MGFLDTLQRQQEPRPMMGRAGFSIQRPSPRVRLDKFKAVLDPMEDRPAPFEGQGFERLTGNPANADVNIDVNADIPMGGEIMENPRQGQGQAEAEVANILAEISGIKGKDYGPRKKGGFKDILLGLGLGALQGAANSDPRGGLGAVLGGAIGGGAAGGIGGAIDGSTDNRMRDRLRLDRLYGDYGQAAKVAEIETNRKYKQKTIENIDADNKARDDKAKADADARTEALKQRKREAFYRTHKNFDPTKATEADVRALAEFGETPDTIGTFDFTKPNIQTIAGQKFLFNANTRSFEDAGLPKDGSKAIVDYTVIDPTTGVESKYSTTSERAAGLKTQLAAAGLQIQAASSRQQAGFQHDEKMTRLRADIAKSFADFKAKLDESSAEKDQTRKLALQQEAERLRQITVNLRKELDDLD